MLIEENEQVNNAAQIAQTVPKQRFSYEIPQQEKAKVKLSNQNVRQEKEVEIGAEYQESFSQQED